MVEALGIAEAGCYTGALAVHQQRQSTEGETTPISVSMRPCIFRAFRHCWPLHLDYGDEGTVWNRWKCSRMGDRLPQWQESNCLLWKGQFWRCNAAVRCPTEMVLGPRIFIQYAEDIAKLFSQHGLHHHLFADDMWGHCSGRPVDCPLMVKHLQHSISGVSAWCASKWLNGNKIELLWFGSAMHLCKISPTRSIIVNNNVIHPATVCWSVTWAYVFIRSCECVTMSCFFHLRRLWSVHRHLSRDVFAKLVSALILLHLDYCNTVLAGFPGSTLTPLQRVLHATARLVLNLKPCNRVTAALRELHWLAIMLQIAHKLSTHTQGPHRSYTWLHHRFAHTGS